ncbi:hypothetical protein ACFX2B_027190 [Malus domestica]
MFTLSATPSTTFLTPRISSSSLSSSASAAYSSSPSSSSRLCLVSLRWRSSACPCFFSTLKVTAMAELVKNMESVSLLPIQCAERWETNHSRTFLNTSYPLFQLMSALRKEEAASMVSHTPNLECQIYETRYLNVDMAVMIQVKNITDIGACASLLEYNNIEGMILFSELSHSRIRSVNNLIKVGRIEPVMVLRVDKDGEDDKLLDSFYHNLTEEELKRVHEYNFDHPDALDTEKLLSSMDKLKHGQAVDIPNYDFKSYKNSVLEIPPLC